MLRIQLEAFEKKPWIQAIASGMGQITFNPWESAMRCLRKKKIHKRLSQIQNIKYFQTRKRINWAMEPLSVRNLLKCQEIFLQVFQVFEASNLPRS